MRVSVGFSMTNDPAQARVPDVDPVDAIVSAPEFHQLCMHLHAFVSDGAGAQEMRTAVHLFADVARLRGWSPEAILKALHTTPCYPRSVGGEANRPTLKRYSKAIDLLLYEYFNVVG